MPLKVKRLKDLIVEMLKYKAAGGVEANIVKLKLKG